MLNRFRKKIQKLDEKILECLLERYQLTQMIGEIKKASNREVVDKKREIEIKNYLTGWCQKNKIPEKKIQAIFEKIFDLSYFSQK